MKNYLATGLVIALTALIFTNCRKKTDCQADITCQDANGKPVSGAEVKLFANVGNPKRMADVKANGVTDKDGKVSFVFQLPAIFDVNAAVGTSTASTLIKLEEGKKTEKIIEIK
ncbi:MAG: hypothetical protein ABIP51_17745 [Bacteroidia bacterium]